MEQQKAVVALSALAQEARLKVFRMLVVAAPEGLSAGVIAARMGIPKATLSFHLKGLVHAQLVEANRSGRVITYRMRPQGIQELLAFLMDDCCNGRNELCSPASSTVNCRG